MAAFGLDSTNLFAYCGNNPILRYDPNGKAFLSIARNLLKTWLTGDGSKKVFTKGTALVKALRKNTQMQNHVNTAISNYKIDSTNSTYSGTVHFQPSTDGMDLYLGVQHANVSISVSKETRTTGVWFWKKTQERYVATVTLTDSYDFDNLRTWRTVGSILNNGAFLAHEYMGVGTDYDFSANYICYTSWETIG